MEEKDKAVFQAKTKKERLAMLDEAIETILFGGQSYKIGSHSLTRADLATLRAMRNELLSEAEEDDPPLLGHTAVAFFDRR